MISASINRVLGLSGLEKGGKGEERHFSSRHERLRSISRRRRVLRIQMNRELKL
ncbi:MAG: hypothetical protein V1835_03040 [Candidatus Micrarchaeota archaeon]